jgi:hypothetical protein
VKLKAGTLYGSLDRLVEAGRVAPDREEVENGRCGATGHAGYRLD